MRQVPHLGSRVALVPAPTTTTVFFLNRPQQHTETLRPPDIAIASTSSGRVNARTTLTRTGKKGHQAHMRGRVQICGQLWHRSLRAKSMESLMFYAQDTIFRTSHLLFFGGSDSATDIRQLLDKFNRLNRR